MTQDQSHALLPSHDETWPSLPQNAWEPTYTTLHRWTQIVGKIRTAFCPQINHWWHTTLDLTARTEEDHQHASYDAEYAQRCCRSLLPSQCILTQFRDTFLAQRALSDFSG